MEEDLYLETETGYVKISPEMIDKLNLKKGNMSPFTNNRIVGRNGEFFKETSKEEEKKEISSGLNKGPEDGVVQLDNGLMLTRSEILDISHGTDSATQ